MDLYQSYSFDSLEVKTDPTLRVTSLNQRNKDVEFNCGENDSGERSRAIMALLFTLLNTNCNMLVGIIFSSANVFNLD